MARQRSTHEQTLFLVALAGGLPALVIAMVMLWTGDYQSHVRWTLTLLAVGVWLGCAASVRERVIAPLHTLANLLEAMREGDFSMRARQARGEDALGEVMQQVNAIGSSMRQNRLGAMEATTLLRKVMAEIEVAVFAFDPERKLRLVNRAGERLLEQTSERMVGREAVELGLEELLEGEEQQTRTWTFPGRTGRWGVRRSQFREGGVPHQLLVLADLTLPLREEELEAWQRLVRVLGHELNNSLTPIVSIASSLESLVVKDPLPEDWQDDMRRGLSVIGSRSAALSRFLAAYARLAKLPTPQPKPVLMEAMVQHVAALDDRVPVTVVGGPELVISADHDQLQQALINLVRNAIEASLDTGGGVSIGWASSGQLAEVWIADEGRGVANPGNLFVPFFTTKAGGSGIGLVLSRRIVEAHGGTLTLKNRDGGVGCEARVVLPVGSA